MNKFISLIIIKQFNEQYFNLNVQFTNNIISDIHGSIWSYNDRLYNVLTE